MASFKKVACVAAAQALAIMVLPVPGGPCIRTPRGSAGGLARVDGGHLFHPFSLGFGIKKMPPKRGPQVLFLFCPFTNRVFRVPGNFDPQPFDRPAFSLGLG